MKKDEPETSSATLTALHHQYNSAIRLLSLSNTRRTASARFFISLVSGLVGLLAIVLRPGVEMETQLWVTNIVALFSIFLCIVWFMTIRSLRHLASIQKSLLIEMEKSLPFAFITRQEQQIQEASGWLNTGKIEQYVPVAMMIPAFVMMLTSNIS